VLGQADGDGDGAEGEAKPPREQAISVTRIVARTAAGGVMQLPTRKQRRAILARARRGEQITNTKGETIDRELLHAIAERAGGRRR
jgi:hypothetical protein